MMREHTSTMMLIDGAAHNTSMSASSTPTCVIVGGGMAGLTAARELLLDKHVQVTLVEASTYFGGRIRGNTTWIPHHVVDIGAEYIHGTNTLLTHLVDEYTKLKWNDNERVTYEAFITAHADGGPHPSVGTTQEGYYGRYYMDQELIDGNDERLQPLHTVLGTLGSEESCCGDGDEREVSIGNVLEKRLPPSLHDVAVASYANTVGCTNLHNVSLHMLNLFEDYWQEHEEEGDLHMDSTIGICGIVKALVEELQSNENFQANLNWQVVNIQQAENGLVQVISNTGEVLEADAVIVTVPPPLLTKLGLELSEKKIQALRYIGFDTAVKFILKFSTRPWPLHLQSVVCAGCLVPEMWFHDYHIPGEDDCFTATCFLTSDCARDFLKLISRDDGHPCSEKAANVVMDQLSEMLNVPKSELVNSFVDCLLFDWSNHPFVQGGYMYPKVGLTQQHLKDLAEPDGKLFFAGEATNTNACCTIQAAMETGVRAANEVKEYLASER